MAVSKEEFEALIKEKFPESTYNLIDLVGDGEHYELHISTPKFSGLSKIMQHKLVYDSLGFVGTTLHALALKTSM